MFAIKTLAIAPAAAIPAATTRTLKGADAADIACYNAVRDYVALCYAADAIAADLDTRAHAMLKDVKSADAYKAARDAFKHVYAADYAARFPKNDDAKRKAAVDMAWSRVQGRAVTKGWEKPDTSSKSPEAIKAAQKREKVKAAKTAANGGKVVDGRAKGNNRKTAQPATAAKSQSAIVATVPSADPEMTAALAWVNSSTANKAAFIAWFKTERAKQLNGGASGAAIVKAA